ncbi:MAG TPA: hypothetical protein VMM60_16385 [Ilumatobacter sp.]|nr:hypothetical protein [Ilumatobacter sp.]
MRRFCPNGSADIHRSPPVEIRPANFYDGLHFINSAADIAAARIVAALPAEG